MMRTSVLVVAVAWAACGVVARSYYEDRQDLQHYNYNQPRVQFDYGYRTGGNNGQYEHASLNGIQFDITPMEQTVHAGDLVQVECRLLGHYEYTAQWAKVGGPLSSRARSQGNLLYIHGAQEEDSGRYVCVANIAHADGRQSSAEGYAKVTVLGYGRAAEQQRADQVVCGNGQRTCQNGYQCIMDADLCNGQDDCDDGSDERGCSSGGGYSTSYSGQCEPNEIKCRNTDRCIQRLWQCDGEDDCGDNSDEQNCGEMRDESGYCRSTEWKCPNSDLCIKKAFRCDKQKDCPNNEDEIGCTAPEVLEPPPPRMQGALGSTVVLKCKVLGVPPPHINWRKNWGPVCGPPRCTQESVPERDRSTGTLTITNLENGDSGAYTCEAINVQARVLVTPDCIVTIGGEPTHPPPPAAQCNPIGSVSPYPGPDGRCKCKEWVTGPYCDQCQETSFYFHADNPHGCIKCFCMGVTEDCDSTRDYRKKESFSYARDGASSMEFTDVLGQGTHRESVTSDRQFVTYRGSMDVNDATYWRVSEKLTGDYVGAYGGSLNFTFKYTGGRQGNLDHRHRPLVILKGNEITFHYDGEVFYGPDQTHYIEIKLYENYFTTGGSHHEVNREHMLMLLADLEEVLIRATHADGQYDSSLGEVNIWVTTDFDTQEGRAYAVEECRCPPGYIGKSCEDCAPGYERSGGGLYLGTCVPAAEPQRSSCNSVGTLDNGPPCRCKENVEGQNCDRCKTGTFHLSPSNQHGCLACFCNGVTSDCDSLRGYYRTQHCLDPNSEVQLRSKWHNDAQATRPQSHPRSNGRELSFSDFYQSSETLYWELPSGFTGNKLLSYGGSISFSIRYDGSGAPSQDPLVIIHGDDGNSVIYEGHHEVRSEGQDSRVSINLQEQYWRRMDRQELTREHLLMILASVQDVLIRAQHVQNTGSSYLSDVCIEYGDRNAQGQETLEVESCRCPPGYTGTSCENCAEGYKRTGGGLYLGTCEACQCNGHSNKCDAKTGVCIDCLHHTEGDYCERCQTGYTGDARRGTAQDCTAIVEPEAPCQCYNHSPRKCDATGRCIECQDNTEGFHCERCKPGYYGDATQGTNYDCTPCPCPANVDCYLDPRTNEPVCKNCPAGYTGPKCGECAAGYSVEPGQTVEWGNSPKCKPIGQFGPGHVDYSQNQQHKHHPEYRQDYRRY